MAHSDQGIVRGRGEEQPRDKARAQLVHKVDPAHSVSGEAAPNPRSSDAPKAPGSDHAPDKTDDSSTP